MNAPPDDLNPASDVNPDPRLGLAADVFAESPPAALAERVLQAVAARPRARVTPAGPVEVLARTVEQAGALFDSLSDQDWAVPNALGPLDVKQTVAHLHGADEYLGVKVGAWPGSLPADEDDHAATTQPSVDAAATTTPSDLLAAWHQRSAALVAHLRTVDAERLDAEWAKFNLIEGPLGAVLIGRAFELWTHTEDICRATGRPVVPPSPEVLAAMTDVGSLLAPVGYQMKYGEAPATVRLVLTGAGGGTWNLPLGPDADPEPAAVIVGDVVEFCRMIAARIDPFELDCDISGDRDLAQRVLVGATQFAMD